MMIVSSILHSNSTTLFIMDASFLITVAVFQFSQSVYGVAERDGFITVTIELAPSSGILSSNISVSVIVSGGTAQGRLST